ncbi:hypothetical protein SAY86_011089 [Trapa natans]|uniref:Gamma-tubulin complex component n=1 Tax=Trapa natans TaxID=22666 RepID=A0AAN7LJK8_TRANT|nr:hypothetical protein SAY86_011089 [Trapa natans]
MRSLLAQDELKMEDSKGLVHKIHGLLSDGLHFAAPFTNTRTNEADVVRAVLQMLQGFSSNLFDWDPGAKCFHAKSGIYVMHISLTSFHAILSQFSYAATCLQLVDIIVRKVNILSKSSPPTLKAFLCCVSSWIKEIKSQNFLFFQEEPYQLVLHLFVGSLQPYVQGLDSWLNEGILDDPFDEMFFHANNTISVEDPEFWEKSYIMRHPQVHNKDTQYLNMTSARDHVPLKGDKKEIRKSAFGRKETSNGGHLLCPLFLKDIAKSIVSAGKSLQLIRYVPTMQSIVSCGQCGSKVNDIDASDRSSLTLSETFCISVASLIGRGDHISKYIWQEYPCNSKIHPFFGSKNRQLEVEIRGPETLPAPLFLDKMQYNLLTDSFGQKKGIASEYEKASNSVNTGEIIPSETSGKTHISGVFYHDNPIITLCQPLLNKNASSWTSLNISKSFSLPPLDDEDIWKAIFKDKNETISRLKRTDFAHGFHFGGLEYLRAKEDDVNMLEGLFPFPTLLPFVQECLPVSQHLPFQKNSTLPARVLLLIQEIEPENTPLPLAVMQECLVVYIKRQVDFIGKQILSKLMLDWRLMDELAVLRAIYLLGSGDLLQHFLVVIFNKLNRGETWDDDFDLNTILQESISNSADGHLLSAPDSLVVSITQTQKTIFEHHNTASLSSPQKNNVQRYGIDGLESLKFTYKVSWPLELIANSEAIKKYNQIMGFLLKVKRAKFVLDKTRRWMWKGKRTATYRCKNHWLVEQKLLHFVDAFHQYVMDRVYHSAWRELCEGMAAAQSLDEVIEVHEAYLLSMQRQCFVVPDKLYHKSFSAWNLNIVYYEKGGLIPLKSI